MLASMKCDTVFGDLHLLSQPYFEHSEILRGKHECQLLPIASTGPTTLSSLYTGELKYIAGSDLEWRGSP
jgi:hypothetical protein